MTDHLMSYLLVDHHPLAEVLRAAASWSWHPERKLSTQDVADVIERLLGARAPGEWVSADGDCLQLTPLLLADLLLVAAGHPVRIGPACFNGAPACAHSTAGQSRTCPDCGALINPAAPGGQLFDRLVERVANAERSCPSCRTLVPCKGCGFPVCRVCGPDCLCSAGDEGRGRALDRLEPSRS